MSISRAGSATPERYDSLVFLICDLLCLFRLHVRCLFPQMLARQERSDRILRDLLRRMQIMEKDKEDTAAAHAAALAGARPVQEFQALEEELKRAREKAAAEKASREKAEQAAETFLGETKKLQAALSSRDEELNIVHARLSASEISRVRAERERETLRAEVQTLIEEKDDAVRSKTELEEDWDLSLEVARYEVAMRVKDATAEENASRGITCSFFDAMFPPLEDELPEDDLPPEAPAEAAQSSNCRSGGGTVGGSGAPHLEDDEEQVDYGSE